jgi:HEAT repeat protein
VNSKLKSGIVLFSLLNLFSSNLLYGQNSLDDELLSQSLYGDFRRIKKLLDQGANVNTKDKHGNTPLHYAMMGDEDAKVFKQLLDAGAKPDIANNEGETPLRLAAAQNEEVYQLMLAANGGKETIKLPPNADQPRKSNQELIAELSSDSQQVRQAAQLSLLSRGKTIIPDLEKLLLDEQKCGYAIDLIPKLGDDAYLLKPKLESMLTDPKLALAAIICFEDMRKGTVQGLPSDLRANAAESLYRAIINLNEDDESWLLVGTIPFLGEPAAPTILKFLNSEKPGYRRCGAEMLCEITFHNQDFEDALFKLIAVDSSLAVREEAVRAAGNPLYHSLEIRRALIKRLEEIASGTNKHSGDLESWTERSLASYGNEVIPELVSFIENGTEIHRIHASHVWEMLPDESAPALAELYSHKNADVRLAAAVSIHGPAANEAIIRQLSSSKEYARGVAADSLAGRNGPLKSIEPLLKVAADAENTWPSRIDAARAALRHDNHNARRSDIIISIIPVLIDYLDDPAFRIRGEAAETLGLIGHTARSALPALQKVTKMSDREKSSDNTLPLYPREQAEKAIELITGEESVDWP